MKYEIRLKKSAQKELAKCDRAIATRILVRIYLLSDDPYPAASRSLVGRSGYRLRVGDYRVVYEVDNRILTIHVIRIGHRREVYER